MVVVGEVVVVATAAVMEEVMVGGSPVTHGPGARRGV